jgi:beta-phosphoglucomutase
MESKIKLIAFDLDGVLADTEEFHYHALIHAIRQHTHLDEQQIIEVVKKDGTSTKSKLDIIKTIYGVSNEVIAKIDIAKQVQVLQEFKNMKPSDIQQHLFQWLREKKYKIALVSNSRLTNVMIIVDKLNLAGVFDLIVTPVTLTPKPDSAMYTYSITELKVFPQETLILEDSPAGIESGVRSGAFVLPINKIDDVNLLTLQCVIDEANYINSHGGKRNQILTGRIQGH